MRPDPVCSVIGGSGERGRGTLRAGDDCLVSFLICVSFPRAQENDGEGVATFLRWAGVGAGRLDDRMSFVERMGEAPQLEIGVPDRDLLRISSTVVMAIYLCPCCSTENLPGCI